jgi:hypothetical protein
MTQPILGLDADTYLTTFAEKIKAAGFSYVGRYLKNVTAPEIAALHAAGLGVWAIFETTTSRSLMGAAVGGQDGVAARQQAQAHGFPPGSVIYATTDTDATPIQLPVVGAYYAAFLRACAPYGCGAYASGNVLTYLTKTVNPAIVPWLAGAMGWGGSRSYAATGDWVMMQGPDLGGRAGTFASVPFPSLGFDYDPDLIAHPERIGAWMPQAAPASSVTTAPVVTPAPASPPSVGSSSPPSTPSPTVKPVTSTPVTQPSPSSLTIPQIILPPLKAVQAYLGVSVDGIWGNDTANAIWDFLEDYYTKHA